MKVIFPSLNFLPAYPNFETLHENTVIFLRAKKISIAVTWRTSGNYCHPSLASQPSTLQPNLTTKYSPFHTDQMYTRITSTLFLHFSNKDLSFILNFIPSFSILHVSKNKQNCKLKCRSNRIWYFKNMHRKYNSIQKLLEIRPVKFYIHGKSALCLQISKGFYASAVFISFLNKGSG